jgi:S-(hydroxymethyl)glutathione dehydrogenase/alcohol dehydrogenase
MKAAVCHAFNTPLSVEEVTLAPPQALEVEVTLEACAICHSDIHFIEGAWGGRLPAVYGHEAAGRITAIGEGVTGYALGDTVVVTLIRSCGTCSCCSSGHPTSCEKPRNSGDTRLHLPDMTPVNQGMATGAFAEKVVVHQSQICGIPEDMPMDSACLLACGVITGAGAVLNTAAMRPGTTALIIGAGGVGLNAIQGARLAGARRIIAMDVAADKLVGAMEFGATDGVLATDADAVSQVRALTGGRGADYVFVTVGAIGAYNSALSFTAPLGTVVMVGMPASGQEMKFEPVNAAAYGQTLIGSNMGSAVLKRDIPMLVDLYQQGRLKLDELITRRYRLEQINEAIADTLAGKARRNVIIFGDAADALPK